MAPKNILPRKKIADFIDNLYDGDLHAKRVLSLANATLGVLVSASLAVHAIGQGLAQALGKLSKLSKLSKHGVKQVDRLLSNQGIDVWEFFGYWVPYLVGARLEVVVAMDWTSFARDQQDTVVLSMLTGHGRATPLMWRTVRSSTLKGQMKRYEKELLERLREVVPSQVKVTVVADRGFGDCKLFKTIAQELGFAYVIRIRGDIYVTSAKGERRKAAQWVGQGGRSRTLRGAQVTDEHHLEVGRVVCVHDRKMKEPWCLVASESTVGTRTLIRYYGKRWGIETSFRDIKDMRFGMGLSARRVSSPQRRDRMLLLSALVIALLSLLGGAGESSGQPHIKSPSHQYLISEVIAEPRPNTLFPDTDLRCLTLQQVHRHMPNHTHIMGPIASTNPTLVFPERDVQPPMQPILDSPVPTYRVSK